MFNDEMPFAFKKMHEFSTVDGFIEITECLAEMIKYVANEPSVGLFYVQQHTHNSVPNIINLKNNVVEKSRGMTLHTEDLEDSVTIVRSMKECGLPIADEMIRDIKKSLAIMSAKQPKRGLIHSPSSGFQMGGNGSWVPDAWGRNVVNWQQDDEKTGSYLSTVLKSAKQRAGSFKWPQLDFKEPSQTKREKLLSDPNQSLSVTAASTSSTMLETEADELPLSSHIVDELQDEPQVDGSSSNNQLLALSENYDEFRADKEAKFEEWLGGSSKQDGCVEGTEAKGP